MISLVLGVVGSEWCEARRSTFLHLSTERKIPLERVPFSESGSTRETKMNSEIQSESYSRVPMTLGCAYACSRELFICSWIGPPGSPVRKGVCESSGVPRLKHEASKMCSEVPWVILVSRGIFRVPYWISFDAPAIRR
ncbi:hypothetical protein CDL15_Pgr014603 [Punica granatum]|uniref:Uncharacterized protein n=1 Tax=Punica granatum TaxID=22663 RepID=A0A218XY08_PUNGR|nr:hypothetical protein CDL15_Pgr014603 [Punica granatum]